MNTEEMNTEEMNTEEMNTEESEVLENDPDGMRLLQADPSPFAFSLSHEIGIIGRWMINYIP